MLLKKNNRTCNSSILKAWGARHIFRMTIIFYIENFFYCILLKKHQFFRFQNFEDSFLKISKYYIEKKYVSILFEHRTRQNIFFSRKNISGLNYAWNYSYMFKYTIRVCEAHTEKKKTVESTDVICWNRDSSFFL